jgi:hypothetical protein
MKTRGTEILFFISFCIENYKNFTGKSGEDVAELFNNLGVMDYARENYDTLHTQNARWLNEEIDEIIKVKQEK